MEHFDLIVIGSGPAGEKGAEQAARFGKSVALVERAEHLGGAGINNSTVPSKTLRETALYFPALSSEVSMGSIIRSRAGSRSGNSCIASMLLSTMRGGSSLRISSGTISCGCMGLPSLRPRIPSV